jgi:hypothetical protein
MSIAERPDQHEQGYLLGRFGHDRHASGGGQVATFEEPQVETSGDVAPNGTTNILPINAAESTKRIAEYDSAIDRRAASFTQLATAIFYRREKFNSSAPGRSAYAQYIKPLTEAFETKHGDIMHSFYCQQVIAAAVLTDRNELCIIPPPFDASTLAIADLLFECERLNVEADRILGGAERSGDLQATKMLIYGVVVKLLTLVDGQVQPLSRELLDLHRRDVTHANDYYLRAAERYAKFDYFRGMLIGIFVCLGLIAISATIWWRFGFAPDVGKALVGCLTAGGIGAVVSVMSRMTFGAVAGLRGRSPPFNDVWFVSTSDRNGFWSCDVSTIP